MKIQAVDEGNGYFAIEADGPFQTEELSIVILSETKNEDGIATDDRKYGLRTSYFYGREHKEFISVNLLSNLYLKFFY